MGDARIYNLALKWSTHLLVSGISLWISRHGPTSRPSTIRSLLASAGASTVGPTANSTSAPSCRSTSLSLASRGPSCRPRVWQAGARPTLIVSEFESLRTGERVAPGPQPEGKDSSSIDWQELRSAGSTETPWFITTDRLGDSLESTSTRRKRLAQLAWQRGAGEVDGGSEDLRNASYASRWRQPASPAHQTAVAPEATLQAPPNI